MRLKPAGAPVCALVVSWALTATPALPADLAGIWEGMIDTDRRPTLIRLHLAESEGGWAGTVEIPGQGSVPLTETHVDGPRVEFVLPVEGGLRFEAQSDADSLAGRMWQGDESVTFRLQRELDLRPPADRADGWRQDLGLVLRKFPAYDRSFPPEALQEFRRRVVSLRESAPERTDAQLTVELAQAVALGGNAHTRLYLLRNRSNLRRLPIRVWWFSHGVHVVRATEPVRATVGRRVLSLGGHTPEALRAATSTLFAGNDSWKAYKTPYFMTSPEVLAGLGLIPDAESVILRYEGPGGEPRTLELKPLPLERHDRRTEAWWDLSPEHVEDGWTVPSLASTPLSLRRPAEPYWAEETGDGLLYLSYSRTREGEGPKLEEIVTSADPDHEVRALVIDLRWNTGGNNSLARPFLEWVEASRFNAPGRLYVIVGRATFSAGLYCAAWLTQHTAATFVGEPVGDELDYWSEGGNILLPGSGLTLHFANGFHGYSKRRYPDREPFFEDLDVDAVAPSIWTKTSVEDWLQGRDTALEAVRTHLTRAGH